MTDYNIIDFGARGDGRSDDRSAIQQAIDAANEAGGGRVIIPTGDFLSTTLILKSNVTIHLDTGATLIGSLEPTDAVDFAKEFGDETEAIGWDGGCFLFARHARNITIEGEGTIYGQGDKVFIDPDVDGGFHECPKSNNRDGCGGRPRTTYFEDVKNLTVRGITFKDAAFWTLHMAGCRHVIVDGIRILNDVRGANNDGIDPDTCQDVVITNCIVKTGDDAIVVKNTAPMAERYGACENIVISNCVLYSRDSALKVGTETFKAIRNVILSDCVFKDCSRGVGIWVRDGATIEDIHVHHVSGNVLKYAHSITPGNNARWWGVGEPIFVSATRRRKPGVLPGVIRDITFDHMYMTAESCIFIAADDDCPIENVRIDDVQLKLRSQGTQPNDSFDEQPSRRDVYPAEVPAVYVRNANDVSISGLLRREGEYASRPVSVVEHGQRVRIDLEER